MLQKERYQIGCLQVKSTAALNLRCKSTGTKSDALMLCAKRGGKQSGCFKLRCPNSGTKSDIGLGGSEVKLLQSIVGQLTLIWGHYVRSELN